MHPLPASLSPPLAFAAAAAILVLPVALWLHWARVAERGGERAWFRFVLRNQLLAVASVLLTVPAVHGLGLQRALAPQGGPAWLPRGFLAWAPAICIALAHLGVATVTFRSVRRRLRGVSSPATGMRDTLYSLLARGAPTLGMLAAVVAVRRSEWRTAGACVLSGLAIGLWLRLRRSRVLGLAPEAVTAGPLRERVFGLAARARVRVEQLLVLAARDARLTNAFAMQGRRVLLTDTLLEQLSRREVDAVIAHELAHLRFHHPQRLLFSTAFSTALVLPFARPLGSWAFTLAMTSSWLVTLVLSRRFEYVADRQAIAWTGDAEALVTGIARISRANDFPLDWGRWTGLVLTHPSTRARAMALAHRGALSKERAEQLLAAPVEDPDRWPFTVETIAPIAGSTARARGSAAAGWGSFAACTLGATLVVELARLSPTRWPELPLLSAGAAAAWLVMLVVFDHVAVAAYRGWRAQLAKRLGVDDRARYVGLSPGEEPRLFEGLADWDIGFLSADPRGICFRGERSQFMLPRDRIRAVTLVPGLPGWIAAPRVAVRWQDDSGSGHALTLRAADVRTMHHIQAANSTLAGELQRALEAGDESGTGTLTAGAPPDPAQVTSQDPWRIADWRTLPALAILLALLSCAATLLAGLPFAPSSGPGAFEVFVSVVGAALMMRAPLLMPRRRAPPAG